MDTNSGSLLEQESGLRISTGGKTILVPRILKVLLLDNYHNQLVQSMLMHSKQTLDK